MTYSELGIRRRLACPCPKCRTEHTSVICSGYSDGGVVVRRRTCPECGHRWYTAQEPEYVVRPERIAWDQTKKPYLRCAA